ncbi:MAG TPA: MFS transporter [Candidatus Bathyarchaeia archaeon]|nr:MFS transporter [Candidatus Bathyarchaeia archaeon]
MRGNREYRLIEGVALFLACIAIQINSEVLAQWGFYFYSPAANTGQTIYVAVGLAGAIFILGLLTDAVSDPIIGLWSDKTRTRPSWRRIVPISGRRRPFIFWGSIGLTFTGIAFWFPPVDGTSAANFVYASVIICLHSAFFFTIVAIPFNALGPELARSDEARVRLGNWIAGGMIVGLAVAVVLPGILIEVLDPVKQTAGAVVQQAGPVAEDAPPVASPRGYQRMAIVFSLISLVLFQFMVWAVRERYDSDRVPNPTPSIQVLFQTVSNRLFLRYAAVFFLFNIGLLGVQRVLPHWVRIGLNGSPKMVSMLMAPFIVMALVALSFMPALSKRVPIKWLFFTSLTIMAIGLPFMYPIAVMDVSTNTKIAMGVVLFGFCGIGQGMLYVLLTPLIGQIIDLDEARTGERREAAYQALHGLNWKASQALAVFVAAQSMSLLGNSVEHPLGVFILGPLAGVFGLIGMAICWTYPVLGWKKTAAANPVEAEAAK